MNNNTIKDTNQAIDARLFTEAEIKAMDSKGFYTFKTLVTLSGISRDMLTLWMHKGILPVKKMDLQTVAPIGFAYIVLKKDWEDFKKTDEYLYSRAIIEKEGATRGEFTLTSLAKYVGYTPSNLSYRGLTPSFVFQSALGHSVKVYKLEDYLRFCKEKGYRPYFKPADLIIKPIKKSKNTKQVKADNVSVGSVLELLPADDKPSVTSKAKELPSWLKIPADALINEVDKMPLQEISNCIPKEVIFKELVEAVGEDKLRNLVFLRKLQETK